MIKEDSLNRLLVEGKDDKYTVINLMQCHGIDWALPHPSLPYVRDCENMEKVLDAITVSAKSYVKLGIILDADSNPQNRWQAISDRLNKIDIQLPEKPSENGVIVKGIRPDWQIGIWLMPDNNDPGYLEDFLIRLIPEGDSCWPYTQTVTGEAKRKGAPFKDIDYVKAEIHTWLAWQNPPGRPFGTALTAACFKHDDALALKFVSWFNRLFGVGEVS